MEWVINGDYEEARHQKFDLLFDRAVALTEIENAFVKADRATLSRTIMTFETSGIVHQIHDGTRIPKYALCEVGYNCEIDQDLHIHFHCTHCDETVCYGHFTGHRLPFCLPQ
ncbi:Fur family transcriptional regulator, ferric uptake regulator [Gillisia sp. Hel1_33_143]|uniref:Fur family ferric uptake transcriptional regulator n=3 Tax=Leeuwenhoekiella TaxID=283735 RepID=A0A4Q0PLK7_9FLAO|nr:hypothetical protein [Leeuwenhoekiella marinoflava]RXG25727.1 hypothetical protein DSM02_895 [Leeuwenhoekiella polynyae]RXG27960.1 hypothetical protein DSL99_2753 [Leeuwenhoekiella marinoflava]SDS54701.1 Fur family transcriptional regulator, ferric uptake regulator [Gillisia sp. Hel1_33_143]SHF60078.1 Fur family transcriptional regulator, ferric uptake regulator [Leeuwenhoekiella marinoflava DSM 3653]